MRKEVFRKQSLERLNKPDELDQCIHVIPPYVWLVLAAVAVIIIGACVWSVFGMLVTEKTCIGYVEDDVVYIYLPKSTDYHIDMNTECFVYEAKGNLPIQLEAVDMKIPMSEVLTFVDENTGNKDNNTEEFVAWVSDLLKLAYSNEKQDFSEMYISYGSVAEKLEDGFVLIGVIDKSRSLFQLMFR